MSREGDEETLHRIYNHDESDISWRELSNQSDEAVRREKMIKFAIKIKAERAKQEREAMLDAYNYLNGKDHTI